MRRCRGTPHPSTLRVADLPLKGGGVFMSAFAYALVAAVFPADDPAILPNTEPDMSPVPPG